MESSAPVPLDERIGRLEQMVGELRGQVERLEGLIVTMRPSIASTRETAPYTFTQEQLRAPVATATTPERIPAPPAPLQQVFCPHCRGGNPPANTLCMWCGRSMQAAAGQTRTIAVPPSIAAQGATPQPNMASSVKASAIPAPPVSTTGSVATAPASSVPGPSALPRKQPDILKSGEFWLSRVGIVLFLLGVGFLFKYSVDQGWLTEWVRVAIGLATGVALLLTGLRLGAHRQALKYILLGGSIATFYVTGYAAYQLFHLVAYELAFSFMVAVTVLAFGLALGYNQSLLSLVGVAGGLATPFVLGERSGGVVGLVTYTCLVAAGGVAVYMFRGWRALLWTTFVGTWLVLLLGFMGSRVYGVSGTEADWALQAGAIFCLLAFWASPVVRETLQVRNPERWTLPSLDYIRDRDTRNLVESHVHALVVLAPLTTLGFSWTLWEATVPSEWLGAFTLLGAVAFGAVAWSLRHAQQRLAYTHAVTGVLLFTLALVQLVHGNVLMVALAVEAAALHFVAQRLSDRGTSLMGHILWGCVTLWLAGQLWRDIVSIVFSGRGDELAFLNATALTYVVVAALALAASFVVLPRSTSVLYRSMVHVTVLGLILRELAGRPNGWGYILLGWAVYAALLQAVWWWAPGRVRQSETVVPSHVIFSLVAVQLAARLILNGAGAPVFFNLQNLIDVAVIALVAGVSFLHKERQVQLFYRAAAHLALLALLWRELEALENGNAFVSIAWGAWACVLLLAGIQLNRNAPLLYAGAGTLALLVGKLFLVDLVGLDAIWRVLIFLGIGGLFLGLSYYFQNVLKRTPMLGEDAEGRQP
ncbi:MAG: DUF2339 domain-containing protein [Chloroflexota bacterium]|nr:DUF2339 domain-containing protein [Chloroflexota bacterium]